jgi:fatty acid synthase subunit beta
MQFAQIAVVVTENAAFEDKGFIQRDCPFPGHSLGEYSALASIADVCRRCLLLWNYDAHLLAVYGFSIVEIVKDNPKEKTIHFGGIKGQAIRKRYMEMTHDTMDKDGNIKTLPLFGDINIRTPKYTFSHPSGLLFATQFAQIALVVTEKAAFEDMRVKGFIQRDCAFAGHSLGEYSALASIADVLPISALVDVVFYRGITMQRAVERDSKNRSNYAMCAVNPSRISKTFSDAALREVVDSIGVQTGSLLEIVNYDVEVCHCVT